MHENHTKELLRAYLRTMEGKSAIYGVSFTTHRVKGLRDGRDSNYFLGVLVVVQIHGMHFFDRSLMRLMQVRCKL